MRWTIEIKPDVFQTIRDANPDIEDGCLVFRYPNNSISIAYAAGTWLTIFPAEEDE